MFSEYFPVIDSHVVHAIFVCLVGSRAGGGGGGGRLCSASEACTYVVRLCSDGSDVGINLFVFGG